MMSTFIILWDRFWRYVKNFIMLGENITALQKTSAECQADIKLQRDFTDSINNNLLKIDRYGSRGVMRSFKGVNKKIDSLSDKLDEHGERISKLEGSLATLVQRNGTYSAACKDKKSKGK